VLIFHIAQTETKVNEKWHMLSPSTVSKHCLEFPKFVKTSPCLNSYPFIVCMKFYIQNM